MLDLLACRKTTGSITGEICLNGVPISTDFKRLIAYVEQEDVLCGTLSVRDFLMFSARLRLPQHMPLAEKSKRVEDAITLLHLDSCADTTIGGILHRGISGGQAKRVNIAMELLINPSILLLDEPTSGLDSATSMDVIRAAKNLAKSGRTVLCTIHQPSSDIFRLFDKLILLKDGQVVFLPNFFLFLSLDLLNSGFIAFELLNDIHTSSRNFWQIYFGRADLAVQYFQGLGINYPDPSINPAEWLLDILHVQDAGEDLAAAFQQNRNLISPEEPSELHLSSTYALKESMTKVWKNMLWDLNLPDRHADGR